MGTTIETGIYIARPPEVIVEVILEAANAVQWTADLERLEVVSGCRGKSAPGHGCTTPRTAVRMS
jgi:hypothetical protein